MVEKGRLEVIDTSLLVVKPWNMTQLHSRASVYAVVLNLDWTLESPEKLKKKKKIPVPGYTQTMGILAAVSEAPWVVQPKLRTTGLVEEEEA